MKTLVIVAHPQLANSSTESFLKAAADDENNVMWHELKTPFDISQEQELLKSATRIIFQFPLYWYSAPAILKQWLDEVWNSQLTSSHLLKGRELGIVTTVAHSASAFQPGASQGYTIAEILRPYQALAYAMGMKYLSPLPIYQFAHQSEEERQSLFIHYQQYLTLDKFLHFSDQTQWFIGRLNAKIARELDPLQQAKLEQLLSLLQDQQEELDDLHTSIGWLREKEDD